MTASEYFQLPEPTGGVVWELHFGELIKVRIPVKRIYTLQLLIRDLIEEQLGHERWVVEIEMPYGLAPGNDVRGADVGVVLRTTWDADPNADVLIGSPDIVVQIKGDRKEEDAVLHIANGASAVWLVKPERREIVVITASSRQVYAPGETIPLPGSASLTVRDIFPV